MGGCATKPKVSKAGDAGEPPASAPEPVKEEAVVAVAESETKAVETTATVPETVEKKDVAAAEVVVAGGVGEFGDGVKEIEVDDGKVDDQVNKRRSLGLLFDKENEEKKSNPELENPPSELVKPEELLITETLTKEPDTESESVETEKTIPATKPKEEPAPAIELGAPKKSEKLEQPAPAVVVEAVEKAEQQEPAPAIVVESVEEAGQERVIEVAEVAAAESTADTEKKPEPEKAVSDEQQ